MSGKKRRKGSSGPDPINFLIDLAGAATLGAIARHKIIKDYERGQGEESARAGTMVFGLGSLRGGSKGIMNFGGLMGLKSGLKEIERREQMKNSAQTNSMYFYGDKVSPVKMPPIQTKKLVRKNMWRDYCEDGSEYGLDPCDFISPDDYTDALNEAKSKDSSGVIKEDVVVENNDIVETQINKEEKQYKCIWHKYCSDGSCFGLNPEDFDNPDDYEEAVAMAKKDIQ